MTLHEAIEKVLKENDRLMSFQEIADRINYANIYKRKDGNPVPISQIEAHINNYPEKFIKFKDNIGLFKSSESFLRNYRVQKPKELVETLEELTKEIYSLSNIPETEAVVFICSLAIVCKKIGVKLDQEGTPLTYDSDDFKKHLYEIINKNKELAEVFEILLKNISILTKEFFMRISFDMVYLVSQATDSELSDILINFLNNVGFFGKQRFLSEFNTPDFINRLVVTVADIEDNEIVFDPASGMGKTLIKASAENKHNLLIGQEINFPLYLINKLYFYLLGIKEYRLFCLDTLKNSGIEEQSVDVIISDIPLGRGTTSTDFNFPTITQKNFYYSEEAYIEYMLTRLKKNGRIVSTIPMGLLHRTSSAYLRKFLIEYDFVESVISLPSNSYQPNMHAKPAIILLNKNKNQYRRNKVLFIDLEQAVKFEVKNNKLVYDDSQISSVIRSVKALLKDHLCDNKEIKHSLIDLQKIKLQRYDLSPSQYDQEVIELLNEASKAGELLPLMEILERIPAVNNKNYKKDVKYVQVRDLNDNPIDFYLNIDNVKSTISSTSRFKILNESALLVSRIGDYLKPTFYYAGNSQIAINQNILAFRVNENTINIGYLITQFNSEFFQRQLNLITRKIGIPYFNSNSFLELKIPVPPFSEQLNRLALFKEQYSQKLTITQFINDIRLVSSNQEIKDEIERFASKTLPEANNIMFKREYEFEKFPFTKKDLEETNFIKQSKDGHYFNLFLHDENKKTNGVLVVATEKIINYEKFSEINAYTNFVLKTSSKYVQENTNRLLNEFSHTTKNILKDINKILRDFLETPNNEFLESMKSSLIKDDEMINYLIEKENRKREDFLAYNRLNEAYRIVNKHFELFKRRHEYYTKSINSESEQLGLEEFLNRIPLNNARIRLTNNVNGNPILIIKSAPIELAFTDLIGNALNHSNGGQVDLIINEKERYVEFIISNFIYQLLSKENYEILGNEDIKNSDGTYSTGMSHAFRCINQENVISLCDYEKYKSSNKFEVTIKLTKK